MSEGIQAPTHDERVADRLAELQAERDAAVMLADKRGAALEAILRRVALVSPYYEMAQAALADPAATALAAEAREMRAKAEAARLRGVANALVGALDTVHAAPAYRAVWECAQLHIGPYRGPKYENALNSLREALAATPPSAPAEQPYPGETDANRISHELHAGWRERHAAE